MEARHGYCRCGCGRKTAIASKTVGTRGVKKGEPNRYVSGHGRVRPMAARLADKYTVSPRTIQRDLKVLREMDLIIEDRGFYLRLDHGSRRTILGWMID